MLTSIRSLLAASALAGAIFAAAPALAQDDTSAVTVSGSAAVVTDYRFRGVGLSNGDPAIQGGITVSTAPGFYVGTWGSSLGTGDRLIDLDDGTGTVGSYTVGSFGGAEIDFFGGWAGQLTDSIGVDIGATYYWYPDASNRDANFGPAGPSGYPTFTNYGSYDTDVIEVYGKITPTLGPVGLTLAAYYSPDQDSLGGNDNLYLAADAGIDIPNTPISIAGHVGYTDGALTYTSNGKAWDYSIGASATVLGGLSLGVAYVGVEGPGGPAWDGVLDDTVVGTLSYSF